MCFVAEGETSRSHEINEKVFFEMRCAWDRSGQLEITRSVIEARNLYEDTHVEQTHGRSGQPDELNSSTARTVKEQHAPEVHRGIALLNTDNEFNREINEEDIDLNIPGLPHSTVKQLHGAIVREFDSENREPSELTCSSTRPTTKSRFMKLETLNCVNYSIRNPKHSAKNVYHTWTSASSTARAGTSCETDQRRTRNLSSTPWISSRFPTTL